MYKKLMFQALALLQRLYHHDYHTWYLRLDLVVDSLTANNNTGTAVIKT